MTNKPTVVSLLSVLVGLLFMTACSEDNDVTITTSGRCSITSVTLGGLKAYLHTQNSEGNDSTYLTTISGSYYRMQIDQRERSIYNLDSLPKGTDVSKVVFSQFTADGVIALRTLSGTDTIYSTSDSIDFTTPRTYVIYATDGSSKKEYTVSVNVHHQEGDEFVWEKRTSGQSVLASLQSPKAVPAGDGRLQVFGLENGDAVLMSTSLPSATAWERTPLSGSIAGFDPRSIQQVNGRFYANADERLIASSDGLDWSPVAGGLPIVAAGTDSLYALYNNSLYSSADGEHWVLNAADEPGSLPEGNCAAIRIDSRTYDNYEDILLTGGRGGASVVWKRTIDRLNHNSFPWIYYTPSEYNTLTLPVMNSTTLVEYDDKVIAFGQGSDRTMYGYISADGGRTWKDSYYGYSFPDVGRPTEITVATDNDHFVWIVCSGTGDVWRGRLNRLSWEESDGIFERSRKK